MFSQSGEKEDKDLRPRGEEAPPPPVPPHRGASGGVALAWIRAVELAGTNGTGARPVEPGSEGGGVGGG